MPAYSHLTRLLAIACLSASPLLVAGCGGVAIDHRTRGDPRAGLSIFKYEGCYACHAIADVSVGDTGPPLDAEGSRRSSPWLRRMLPRHIAANHLQALSAGDLEDLVSYLEALR